MRTSLQHDCWTLYLIGCSRSLLLRVFILSGLLYINRGLQGKSAPSYKWGYVSYMLMLLLRFTYFAITLQATFFVVDSIPSDLGFAAIGETLVWTTWSIMCFTTPSRYFLSHIWILVVDIILEASKRYLFLDAYLIRFRLGVSIVIAVAHFLQPRQIIRISKKLILYTIKYGRITTDNDWVALAKSYVTILPFLWPEKDLKAVLCFITRFVFMICSRYLPLALHRQQGLVVDAIIGRRILHNEDLLWWTILELSKKYINLSDNLAQAIFQTASNSKLTKFTLNFILGLSPDIQRKQGTEKLIRIGEKADIPNKLLELIIFNLCPTLFDLGLALYFVQQDHGTYLALLVIAVVTLYEWLGAYAATKTNPLRRTMNKYSEKVVQTFRESISMHSIVTFYNRGSFELDRYEKADAYYTNAYVQLEQQIFIGLIIRETMQTIAKPLAIKYLTKQDVVLESLENLLVIQGHWNRTTKSVKNMTPSFRSVLSLSVDAESYFQMLGTKPTIDDPEPVQKLVLSLGMIEYRNVDFTYNDHKPLLQEVSFVVLPGHKVALVGATGSGKSTILNLLLRGNDINGGSIMIDGQDVRSVTLESLRDACGIVSQDVKLFARSIRDNVRYGRLNATDQEIEHACKEAAIHDKIMDFPKQYETLCVDGGVRLSGGEVQRIAIARLILKNPKIVLLDEATSALDTATEASIQSAMDRVFKNQTTIVVAHRLSTVVAANKILVVDDGRIVEQGTHSELLRKRGKYSKLWGEQVSEVNAF